MVGETDTKVRWQSVLVGGKCNPAKSTTHLNLKNGLYFGGNRYESTAAASSDATGAPPVEKYEYQAEVCHSNCCGFFKVLLPGLVSLLKVSSVSL